MTAEALRVQQWTAQAVQHLFSVWHNADAASVTADTSASMASALQMVSTVLRDSARDALPLHPLYRLPRPVLRDIRSHLTLPDTMALARTCSGLSNAIIHSPELWTAVETRTRNPVLLHPSELRAYVEYSVAEPLRVSLLTTGNMFRAQAPILSRAMPRVTTLHLHCCDVMSSAASTDSFLGSDRWSKLLDVLTEPAPFLASLQLRYLVGHTIDICYPAVDAVTIDHPLFGGVAPSLRRCRLVSIQFPHIALCGAFRDITTFSYCTSGRVTPTLISLILEAMPRLEVLELEGFVVSSEPDDDDSEERSKITPPSSLRVLMCSCMILNVELLSGVLPFERLQELWLSSQSAAAMFSDLAQLFPRTVGIQLSIDYPGGQFGSLGAVGSDAMPKVAFTAAEDVRLADSLGMFASITWLSIHEHLLSNDAVGPPPELPDLQILCVCLASCSEHLFRASAWADVEQESSGFLIGDSEQRPWELPALREVRVSGPAEEDISRSRTRHPISVSLHDIARWIRFGLVFGDPPGAKLDAVVLSRIWVADYDFCVGWDTLMERTTSIQLEGGADPWYSRSLTDGMLYHTRSASLFP